MNQNTHAPYNRQIEMDEMHTTSERVFFLVDFWHAVSRLEGQNPTDE